MRLARVAACLGEVTQQIHSLRASGVMSSHAARAFTQAAALPPMPEVVASELLVDKRATFAAVPGLARPGNATPWPRIWVAGDWTDTGYPAVLEGAVRSGRRAATQAAAAWTSARGTG